MPVKRPPDKRTRWPGVVARHRLACPPTSAGAAAASPATSDGRGTPCANGRSTRRPTATRSIAWTGSAPRATPFKATVQANRAPRSATPAITQQELAAALLTLANGTPPTGTVPVPALAGAAQGQPAKPAGALTADASAQFIEAMREGVALNKKGKPYKASARKTIEGALKGRVARELGSEPLNTITRGQVQTMIDEMVMEKLSGSRVRNVLNALRSLYRFAIPRDLAVASPITDVVLPAIDENPRKRIATPGEFVLLLAALQLADAVPFALAAYATARSQEVTTSSGPEVDWQAGMLYLADEEDYAKSENARRPFPLIAPLRAILQAEHARQGNPTKGLVCPGRKPGGRNSGLLSTGALYIRADDAWGKRDLEPIRLQECRHTASRWMRAAGIELKLRSVLMGHASTASTDHGPGSITDDRYTHVLPGEVEQAGERLEAYLLAAVETER